MNPLRIAGLAAYLWCCPNPQPVWAGQMFEITIYTCLTINPTNCSSTVQIHDLPANPSAAYREAQAIVAKYIEAHPGLRLRGFDLMPDRGA
jgi:hypothetical protein